jgi:hypothetical protein
MLSACEVLAEVPLLAILTVVQKGKQLSHYLMALSTLLKPGKYSFETQHIVFTRGELVKGH